MYCCRYTAVEPRVADLSAAVIVCTQLILCGVRNFQQVEITVKDVIDILIKVTLICAFDMKCFKIFFIIR